MVFTRLVAMSGYQMGEVVPVVLGIAYTISQVPSYIFPKELIERVHKMRDANGEEVTLTLKMNQAFDRELCESGVENTSIIDVQTFVSRSHDVMSRGMFSGRFDCLIGLPLYFNYETRADVDEDDLDKAILFKRPHFYRSLRQKWARLWRQSSETSDAAINDNPVSNDVEDGNNAATDAAEQTDAAPTHNPTSAPSNGVIDFDKSPAVAAYKESLVLSSMAKRFAVARIIHETDRFHLMYAFATGYVGIELALYIYRRSIRNLTPSERRMKRRMYAWTTMAMGAFIFYAAIRIRNNYYERSADLATASIGPDYAAGGIEYYEKMLARHRALRQLLGKEGQNRFKPNGNVRNSFANWIEEFSIPMCHRPITDRLRTVTPLNKTTPHRHIIQRQRNPTASSTLMR